MSCKHVLGSCTRGTIPILGKSSTGWAGWASVDLPRGRVIAGVPARYMAAALSLVSVARLNGSVGADMLEVRERPVMHGKGDACLSQENCGSPLRGGIRIEGDGSSCSSGFTARKTDGSYWLYTAGHCGRMDTAWRHYAWGIGPIRGWQDSGRLDVAAIRKDNPVWSTGGYVYYSDISPQGQVWVAITSMNSIGVGETVCGLGYVGGKRCGPIENKSITSPAGRQEQVQVYAPSCKGDSGGSWVWPYQTGKVWAYGIHASSSYPDSCAVGEFSYFTPLPSINELFTSARVEERAPQ